MVGMMGGKDVGVMSTLGMRAIVVGFGLCAFMAGMPVKNWLAWRPA